MQELTTILENENGIEYNTTIQIFDSELEYQDILLKYSRNNPLEHFYNCSYTATDFKEQFQNLRQGDTSFVKTFNKALLQNKKMLSNGEINRTSLVSSQQGYMPNVAAVLANNPKCFYKPKTKEIKTPIINFYYDIVCQYSVSAKEREKYLNKLFLKICELEKNGYRVRVNVMQVHCGKEYEKRLEGFCFVIKKEYEKMNITRLTYPLIKTDFLRGLGFAWYRGFCFEKSMHKLFCYGHPLFYEETLLNNLLRCLKKKNEKVVYVNMFTNLDSLIKEIKKGEN